MNTPKLKLPRVILGSQAERKGEKTAYSPKDLAIILNP